MKRILLAAAIILSIPQVCSAELSYTQQLERRIDMLRAENERLYRENESLKRTRRGQYQGAYRTRPLSEANREIRELEQLKRSWERMTD